VSTFTKSLCLGVSGKGAITVSRILWLPQVLRDAGLVVHEEPGWQERGRDDGDRPYGPLRGVMCHATASSTTSTPREDIDIIAYTGSNTAPFPISQLFLARNGEWTVIGSGRCNHVKKGRAGLFEGLGNQHLIGIEAANNDAGEPWGNVQYESYVRGVTAICAHMGWTAEANVGGHKEHQPGDKVDPTFDMSVFRSRVSATLLTGGSTVDFEDVLTALSDGTTKEGAVRDKYPGVWAHLSGRTLNDIKAAASSSARVDIDALVAALAPQMQAIAERAAEQAARKVLGEGGGNPPK
jgi:hypothetical protein